MNSPTETIDTLFQLLTEQGTGDYIGENISQLDHCLQAAHSASLMNANTATILAALLHDVGQFLPDIEAQKLIHNGENVGRVGHEKVGEEWLKSRGFPAEIYTLVGAHVIAKRYLCGSSQTYYEALSSASKASLIHQGGPFTDSERAEFEKNPLWKQMIELRQWDDAAKVLDLEVPLLDSYRERAIEVLTQSRSVMIC